MLFQDVWLNLLQLSVEMDEDEKLLEENSILIESIVYEDKLTIVFFAFFYSSSNTSR